MVNKVKILDLVELFENDLKKIVEYLNENFTGTEVRFYDRFNKRIFKTMILVPIEYYYNDYNYYDAKSSSFPIFFRYNKTDIFNLQIDDTLIKSFQVFNENDPYGEEIEWDDLTENYKDIDPLGEENWNEETLFEIGDEVICVRSDTKHLKIGKNYKVVDYYFYGGYQYLMVNKPMFWKADRFIKKKLNESKNNKWWLYDKKEIDEMNFSKPLYKVGDKLRCIKMVPITNNGLLLGHFYAGKTYDIIEIKTTGSSDFIYLKSNGASGRFNVDLIEKYFDKITNESFSEQDPFGEEQWDDYDENIFKVGDKVKCVQPPPYLKTDDGSLIFNTQDVYTIEDIFEDDDPYFSCKTYIRLNNSELFLSANRFTKRINENTTVNFDIDPFGEEDWDDRKNKMVPKTTYAWKGHWLTKEEIIDIIRPDAEKFFLEHTERNIYYRNGMSFMKREFGLNETNEIDPYGEEDWNEDSTTVLFRYFERISGEFPIKREYKDGDRIYGFTFSKNNVIYFVFEKEYSIGILILEPYGTRSINMPNHKNIEDWEIDLEIDDAIMKLDKIQPIYGKKT
jgi:hypothetical protein